MADAAGALAAVERIASEVAAVHAHSVDRDARFPDEVFDALRSERLLGALVPAPSGGLGLDLADVAAHVRALGRGCASSAMVLAMHHIQVACLVRHGSTPWLEGYTARVAADQLLLASATTEIGVGGDVRTSRCAVEEHADGFRLEKEAPVISYGEEADAVLATARRSPESAPGDQVIVVCEGPGLVLERSGEWDTLGFRGTCSPGFRLAATGPRDRIVPDEYGLVSAATMLPTAHVLWANVWLGIADDAVAVAQRSLRDAARRQAGTVPDAARPMAELSALHFQFAALVTDGLTRYLGVIDDKDACTSIGFAVAMNALKVSASTMVVDVVTRAMRVCGIAAYRDVGPLALGRHLRDAHGAAIMVNNDRILGNTAQLLLVHRGS